MIIVTFCLDKNCIQFISLNFLDDISDVHRNVAQRTGEMACMENHRQILSRIAAKSKPSDDRRWLLGVRVCVCVCVWWIPPNDLRGIARRAY